MVGIVLVSHTEVLARSVAELIREIGLTAVRVVPAGGTDDDRAGTSAEKIAAALSAADAGDGVVVLADLGSAVLTSRLVVEDRDADSGQVQIADAPFVEGAVAAAAPDRRGPGRDRGGSRTGPQHPQVVGRAARPAPRSRGRGPPAAPAAPHQRDGSPTTSANARNSNAVEVAPGSWCRYQLSILQAEFSLTQLLDRPVTGRIFFEQVIRDNLDLGRPDRVGLVFDRSIYRGRENHTPGTFATRVVTDGVTPSLHVQYKNTQVKQYHKQGRALRTETTITNSMDFDLGKRLTNLRALARIGYAANRRLLRALGLAPWRLSPRCWRPVSHPDEGRNRCVLEVAVTVRVVPAPDVAHHLLLVGWERYPQAGVERVGRRDLYRFALRRFVGCRQCHRPIRTYPGFDQPPGREEAGDGPVAGPVTGVAARGGDRGPGRHPLDRADDEVGQVIGSDRPAVGDNAQDGALQLAGTARHLGWMYLIPGSTRTGTGLGFRRMPPAPAGRSRASSRSRRRPAGVAPRGAARRSGRVWPAPFPRIAGSRTRVRARRQSKR